MNLQEHGAIKKHDHSRLLQQEYLKLEDAFGICFRHIKPCPITYADGGFTLADVVRHENGRPLMQVRRVVVTGDFDTEDGPRIESASDVEGWGRGEDHALLLHVAMEESVGRTQHAMDTGQFLIYMNGMGIVMSGTWGEPLAFDGFDSEATDKALMFWFQSAGEYLASLLEWHSANADLVSLIKAYISAFEEIAEWELK
jgi:hypothetical protein